MRSCYGEWAQGAAREGSCCWMVHLRRGFCSEVIAWSRAMLIISEDGTVSVIIYLDELVPFVP